MKTTIEVLRPGCFNWSRLEQAARDAIAIAGVEAEIRSSTARWSPTVACPDPARSPNG